MSYLHVSEGSKITVSLSKDDADSAFHSITPIPEPYELDGDAEIQRVARFFVNPSKQTTIEPETYFPDVIQSGFLEGGKIKRTHVITERNSKIRDIFFKQHDVVICDACSLDTKKTYHWTDRVLDIHHLLPLSSGIRVDSRRGTLLDDLVPICPTCHRAVHRFYEQYLKSKGREDFVEPKEANIVYRNAKESILRRYYNEL